MKASLPIELINLLKPISPEERINSWAQKKTFQLNATKVVYLSCLEELTKNSFNKHTCTSISVTEEEEKENSLQAVINLVDQWLSDESGYDEETYPQIESELKQSRLSI